MALTLGTNAYIEVETFKSWCDDRDLDYSSFTDSKISGNIVVCSVDFIDTRYTFKGTQASSAQAMQLPTDLVAIADIENGTAQAVWQQLNGQLQVDLSTISTKGQVKREMSKLDVMEEEIEYTEYTQKTDTVSTARIDAFFKPFVVGSAGGLGETVTL